MKLLEFLRDRFGGKTYVAGFSFGGTVGASAAARRPDLVAMLVAVGMDIDGAAAGAGVCDFALAAARQRGSRRATRQLQAIGPPPHLTAQSRVVALVIRGHSTRQIVRELHISANTVQEHLTAAFDKLGVRSRRELVAAVLTGHH